MQRHAILSSTPPTHNRTFLSLYLSLSLSPFFLSLLFIMMRDLRGEGLLCESRGVIIIAGGGKEGGTGGGVEGREGKEGREGREEGY